MAHRITLFISFLLTFVIGYFSGQIGGHKRLGISHDLLFKQLEALDYSDIQSVLFNHNSANLILIDQLGNARTIPTKLLVTNRLVAEVSTQATTTLSKNSPLDASIEQIKNSTPKPSQEILENLKPASTVPIKMTNGEVNQKILSELPIYLFSKIPTQMSLIYTTNAKQVKDSLVVFTDPSCPHCREFHAKYLPRLLQDGYNVRYFPVARISAVNPDGSYQYNSQVEKRLQWALCLNDRFDQIDQLFIDKARRDPKKPTECDDAKWNVENNIKLSFHFVKAARGTPAIFSKNGYASNKLLANGIQITPGIPSYSETNYLKFIQQLAYFEKPNKLSKL
ncbi:MAG: thioredoxin fold domain-containing protein [Enterobacterales bacterium]|nr:thioredoxin fold domain-containing protein [Enterobacterales bacterium]